MSKVRSTNTNPEIQVRKRLFSKGFRFRINVKSLPGTPDIVLPKYRTCIFVNGCFWHGHKGCKLYTVPATNTEFWENKVARNRERDLLCYQSLESLSWNVITVWECELKKGIAETTYDRIEHTLAQNKVMWNQYQEKRRQDKVFRVAEERRKKSEYERLTRILKEKYNIPGSVFRDSLRDADEIEYDCSDQ